MQTDDSLPPIPASERTIKATMMHHELVRRLSNAFPLGQFTTSDAVGIGIELSTLRELRRCRPALLAFGPPNLWSAW